MERRAFILSLSLSLLAMYLVYQYITGKEAEMEKDFGKATSESIVVATRDILQYQTIRPTDVELITVPAIMLPPGRINNTTDVIDSVAAIPISKGEFILDNKIISQNVYSGLDSQITLGRRAVSIPVNVKSSVGYMLRPGNRVDLAAHFEYRSPTAKISEVKIFLEDVLVLASGKTIQTEPPSGVDQNVLRNVLASKQIASSGVSQEDVREAMNFAKIDPNYQTVTLEVTPEQAQIIVYVMTVYSDSIICMLRQADDRQLARYSTADLANVMGEDSFYVKGRKLPPSVMVPLPKFYDYIGTDAVPVTGYR